MAVCIHHAREACRAGLENGDFLYATYGAFTETWPAIVSARDLGQFLRDYAPGLTLIRKLKNASFGDACELVLNWVRALRGETRAPRSLSYEGFDEAGYVETYRGNPFFTIFHAAARMQIDYLFGEYEAALAASRMARGIVPNLAGMIWTPFHDFWNSLVLAANFAAADEATRRDWLDEMRQSRAALAVLAENCPANYRCWHLLVSAEIERVTGAGAAAVELYEQAIADADANDSVQHRALVHELCGRFWRGRGQHRVAEAFLTEARRGYARWGASAIAERLQTAASAATPLDGVTAGLADTLDLSSAMKAAQAIAGEMNLASLLAKLMQIAIENAGAEHGRLILKHGDRLEVHGETGEGPLESSPNLAVSVVNYALHSSESLVLTDAAADDRFASDAYLQRRRLRSVMCVPMLRHGEPVGALYLENNLAAGAFTEDRLAVMQVLASQAAISIENARLYDEMSGAENTLRSIMEGTAAVTGDDFFASLVRNLAEAMGVRYAFVTECRERPPVQARTLAFWMGNRLAGEVSYEIAETPCLKVLGGETCYYPNGVRHLFPNDQDLAAMGAEGYLGIPMRNAAGATIGHLAILDDKPLPSTPRSLSMLNIFAARAGAELERLHTEQELRRALAEVERLKNQFQAETRYLQEEIRHEHNFEEIVGTSPALLDVLKQVERVAPTDATVLILGETGTGKELIARAIHDNSPRRARALVKVNCGAISAGLVESELFGHVKGAFTGANDKRTGRFELADGGTLFLDEVGELPLETQVKLLRVLQEGEFEPVGSSRTVKVDVRVIAATNRNLEDEVRAGRFRADLFYRLNVLPLHNPPLRQRKEDIPQLALFFLARFARRFGKAMDGITQETMDLLQRYDWPGNIRELQNLIERGVVLGQGSTLTLDRSLLHVQAETRPAVQAAAQTASVPLAPAESLPVANPPASLDELQRQHILHALTQANWVIEGDRGAAKLLDLHPNTLRSRLKKMGIQRPK
jgi:transcriptional regulator with GAF, ATPase, and Fis domain